MIESRKLRLTTNELPFNQGETLYSWAVRAAERLAPGWTLRQVDAYIRFVDVSAHQDRPGTRVITAPGSDVLMLDVERESVIE